MIPSSVGINDNNFTKVHEYVLPKNETDTAGSTAKKYMTGNPFVFTFHLSDVYFRHSANAYKEMGDTNNDAYINKTFYAHDSQETGPVTGYEPVDPSTPGVRHTIEPMEGFFIKIIKDQTDSDDNHFAYPTDDKIRSRQCTKTNTNHKNTPNSNDSF